MSVGSWKATGSLTPVESCQADWTSVSAGLWKVIGSIVLVEPHQPGWTLVPIGSWEVIGSLVPAESFKQIVYLFQLGHGKLRAKLYGISHVRQIRQSTSLVG